MGPGLRSSVLGLDSAAEVNSEEDCECQELLPAPETRAFYLAIFSKEKTANGSPFLTLKNILTVNSTKPLKSAADQLLIR